MQYDISHLLREPVGFRWDVEVDEVGTAEPVKGERIQGQLRLTRFNQGVWAEARLPTEALQVCDRRLRIFRQPVRAEFTELCRTAEAMSSDMENGEPFVNSGGVLDLWEVSRQHLILNLPAKLLCSPQCVGMRPHCGVYGDKQNHYCRTQDQDFQSDPRWKDLTALAFSGERDR